MNILEKKHKRVWAAAWINHALFTVWKFQNCTLNEAANVARIEFLYDSFWRNCDYDTVFLNSKHPLAMKLKKLLDVEEHIDFMSFTFGKRLGKEYPNWLKLFPLEQMVKEEIISDPLNNHGLQAQIRVSTHHRYAATKTALK